MAIDVLIGVGGGSSIAFIKCDRLPSGRFLAHLALYKVGVLKPYKRK